ncbi:hypothetical protein ASPFODRAFT_713634 [Aspergillus luchuensis CBS 106.47]|uniref:Uncharacterized protein n=1 Tax=Aspergillus luchuensis (strain CBS 106.47) TaxID=1137211 RepID=A0A1M3TQB4_ASPLC|nr:hypothetical protein ASPFODRAFT_713634 [Aspergillus luchuensis CBS 106.47]
MSSYPVAYFKYIGLAMLSSPSWYVGYSAQLDPTTSAMYIQHHSPCTSRALYYTTLVDNSDEDLDWWDAIIASQSEGYVLGVEEVDKLYLPNLIYVATPVTLSEAYLVIAELTPLVNPHHLDTVNNPFYTDRLSDSSSAQTNFHPPTSNTVLLEIRPHKEGESGSSLLHFTAANGNLEIVSFLLPTLFTLSTSQDNITDILNYRDYTVNMVLTSPHRTRIAGAWGACGGTMGIG